MVHEYYVYIIKCIDDTFYIGVTNSLERRFKEHCEGLSETSYTCSRRPLELVYHEKFKYIDVAIAREKQLKRWSRKKKKALINGDLDKLKEFSKKKF
jgi:putative endonuclease